MTTTMRSKLVTTFASTTGSLALCLLLALNCAGETTTKPNRTLPLWEASEASLKFSANPTTEELFRARVFQEPLVVVGGEPTPAENAALAAALLNYSKRSGPDDFSALTDFLQRYPQSPWAAALLTDLGLEYYNTAHYSLAIAAWSQAWALADHATDRKALALVDRAF